MEFQQFYADAPKNSILFNTETPILRQLFATFDDTVFAWTPKALKVAVGFRLHSSKTEAIFTNSSVLFLTCRPFTPVLHLELNRSGSRLALVCATSCYVVQIPLIFWNLRNVREKLESEYLCSCSKLDSFLTENSDNRQFLRVRWHPGSPTDKHLVTLCTDNVIRIYNVDSGESAVQNIILTNIDSFAVLSPRAQNLRFSIGESAVSFDFGPPVKLPTISKDYFYPIFVLYGNGDVYSVLTDVCHSRQFTVNGPLTISPPAEDNYGVDSCDMLILSSGTGPRAVTVLAIATTYGNLYHSIIFMDDISSVADEQVGASFSLHVYESVELEFSLSTVDLITKELKEDTYESPIRLFKDNTVPQRFFCAHGTGLHSVYLKWMHDLERINADILSSENRYYGFDSPAVVNYCLCTCPQKDEKAAPILGLANVVGQLKEKFLTILLNDFSLQNIVLSGSVYDFNVDSPSASTIAATNKPSVKREFFIDHVKNTLQRNVTMPLLRSQNKNLSEQETAELLLRSIDVFRSEYVKKLENAQRLCLEMCDQMVAMRKKQENDIKSLSQKSERFRQRQNSINQRLDSLSDAQKALLSKLDFINSSLSQKSGPMSSAEEEMLKELRLIEVQTEMINDKLKRLSTTTKSYENSLKNTQNRSTNVDDLSLTVLQKRLEEQSQQIETLTGLTKKILAAYIN